MKRREFLATSVAALGAAAFAQETPKKKRSLKKAVNLGMVKADGASVRDKFQMIRDAGFDGVELNRPDAMPMDELLEAKKATGLEVGGIICTTHWGKPL